MNLQVIRLSQSFWHIKGIARKAGENNIHPRCDFAHYSILEEEIEI